jgi:hypothetical protein
VPALAAASSICASWESSIRAPTDRRTRYCPYRTLVDRGTRGECRSA